MRYWKHNHHIKDLKKENENSKCNRKVKCLSVIKTPQNTTLKIKKFSFLINIEIYDHGSVVKRIKTD